MESAPLGSVQVVAQIAQEGHVTPDPLDVLEVDLRDQQLFLVRTGTGDDLAVRGGDEAFPEKAAVRGRQDREEIAARQ